MRTTTTGLLAIASLCLVNAAPVSTNSQDIYLPGYHLLPGHLFYKHANHPSVLGRRELPPMLYLSAGPDGNFNPSVDAVLANFENEKQAVAQFAQENLNVMPAAFHDALKLYQERVRIAKLIVADSRAEWSERVALMAEGTLQLPEWREFPDQVRKYYYDILVARRQSQPFVLPQLVPEVVLPIDFDNPPPVQLEQGAVDRELAAARQNLEAEVEGLVSLEDAVREVDPLEIAFKLVE